MAKRNNSKKKITTNILNQNEALKNPSSFFHCSQTKVKKVMIQTYFVQREHLSYFLEDLQLTLGSFAAQSLKNANGPHVHLGAH